MRGNPYAFGVVRHARFRPSPNGGKQKLFTKGSGRLELAEEIVKHALLARGRGRQPDVALGSTSAGHRRHAEHSRDGRATRPTYTPELLDWHLATKFVADGTLLEEAPRSDILLSRT